MLKRYVFFLMLACWSPTLLCGVLDDLLKAINSGDERKVAHLLQSGVTVEDFEVKAAIQKGQTRIVEMLLAKGNPTILTSHFAWAANNRNKELFALLMTHASKSQLLAIQRLFIGIHWLNLDWLDAGDFLKWLKAGSNINGLSKKDALRFAPIAFIVPACIDEFKKLLPFFTQPEDFIIFTPGVIKKALVGRNIEAFKLLLPKIASNRTLLNSIRDELNDPMYDQNFISQLRKLIEQEIKPESSKMGKGDVNFTFE